MHDFVSVIMPSYNTAKYIAASIASVQRQTYQSWDRMTEDDCSTEHTDAEVTTLLTDQNPLSEERKKQRCGGFPQQSPAGSEGKVDCLSGQ